MLLRHPAVRKPPSSGLPDARWGEAPHAFVVLEPEAPAAVEELRQFSRAISRTSRPLTASLSFLPSRKPRLARSRSTFCAPADRPSPRNDVPVASGAWIAGDEIERPRDHCGRPASLSPAGSAAA